MKKGLLSAVYTIIMPYLIFACVYFLLSKQDEVTGAVFALFVVIIILISMMGIAACVVCNIVSLAALTEVGSARRNLIIKLCHIPAHLVVAAIVSGFMNPFLLLLRGQYLLPEHGMWAHRRSRSRSRGNVLPDSVHRTSS